MGNSPSRTSNSNTLVPKSSSSNQQQLTTSDDLNNNEPNDPDDSRPPTIYNKNTKDIEVTSIPIKKPSERTNFGRNGSLVRNQGSGNTNIEYSATPGMVILSTNNSNSNNSNANKLKSRNSNSNYNLDIDISLAKAFSTSTTIASVGSSNSDYFGSSGSSENTLFISSHNSMKDDPNNQNSSFVKTIASTPTTAINTHNHLSTSQVSNKMNGSYSGNNSYNNSGVSTSFSSIPNYRSTAKPVFLKRYPHDSSSSDGLDVDDAIEKLLKLGESRVYKSKDFPFHSWEIQLICYHAREIFMHQPSLLKLQAPIKVVGDLHGQYSDLLRILKLSGVPPETNYLCLGDYVDRGKQSLETILLLLCYKIKYKDNFFMLRGNHESANVTKMYGFYDECKRRKNTKVWKMFIDVFNTLPFAAVIQDKIFCVHGGISPELKSMEQIESIKRPTDIPDEGLITDILWSDPNAQAQAWSLNDRGVSYTFGKKTVVDFCSQFKFDLIIRGHMVVEDGYEFFAKKKLVTVFSAPNYCGEFQNWGAVMSVTTGLMCSFELLKPHVIKQKKSKN
ncbi:hypothetical protein Kpol_1033p29 [Vanderwaltozyma polyspora DSM 70294]|uniref:Serine/threonine-protein phosphatase n=1 Tax=Vanderwaltozyma polyspora (strain ATCC 22028 / DSM 70294 / BCRC 21397 / CBS 2163 / NBRC 10782 / NRRL Y-8283 / UCD 57-17) TaxID=436907 RepID=A7TJ25_VANPO|nr:uncharacterized protein Kpol_1033p29 [Vanderwaltozyma polyspora DSM 70294]EDO17724.1 hypothetical protein Kpol_1033p29 [Vanderwaltozyma polyspora DSM 70294]